MKSISVISTVQYLKKQLFLSNNNNFLKVTNTIMKLFRIGQNTLKLDVFDIYSTGEPILDLTKTPSVTALLS